MRRRRDSAGAEARTTIPDALKRLGECAVPGLGELDRILVAGRGCEHHDPVLSHRKIVDQCGNVGERNRGRRKTHPSLRRQRVERPIRAKCVATAVQPIWRGNVELVIDLEHRGNRKASGRKSAVVR